LDYLLKPFGRDRLERALCRAQAFSGSAASLLDRTREALQPRQRFSRIFVREGNRIVPIPLVSIERAPGADDYVTIYSTEKRYLVSVRLSDLEGQLAGASFLRIHRSHLINLEYVTSIEPYDAARAQVVMKSGTRIVASRAGSKRLRCLAL
jgi:two-component system LytT family response regulator